MTKIYTCILASAMALAANGQILTQSSNAPANGDTYTMWQCDSLNLTPGASGAGATWNYSAMTIHTNVVSSYTTIPATTPGYPPGCLVTAASLNDQSYYMSSSTDLRYYGGNFKVQTVAGKFIYSSPATAASYPMSLNTTSAAAIAGTVDITAPTNLSGSFTGSSTVLADGSGTLILPGATGTYSSVLRVVSSQTINYTTPLASGVITKVNFDYYISVIKAPLFSFSTFTLTSSILPAPSTQTIVTVNKAYQLTDVAIGKHNSSSAAVSDLEVYPNPASSQVNFITENKTAKEIRIFDITGKLLETKTLNEGSLKLDVSAYNRGLYLYSLLDQSGKTLKTGKVTVN